MFGACCLGTEIYANESVHPHCMLPVNVFKQGYLCVGPPGGVRKRLPHPLTDRALF